MTESGKFSIKVSLPSGIFDHKEAVSCIYCQAEGDGSSEHVIPESLNGILKIENATCQNCKHIINSHIEGPLLGYFWKGVRRQIGYRSKKRGKKAITAIKQPTVTFTISRNTTPFQKVTPAKTHMDRQPMAIEGLPAPPFLIEEFSDIPREPALNFGAVNPIDMQGLHQEARELRRNDPDIISVKYNFPGAKMGLLPRLIIKIGCGLSWYLYKSLATEDCRKLLLNGGPLDQMHAYARSCPREYFEIEDDQVKTFTKIEDGQNHMYYAFTLLPEVLPRVFFFRTGVKQDVVLHRTHRVRL